MSKIDTRKRVVVIVEDLEYKGEYIGIKFAGRAKMVWLKRDLLERIF